MHRLKFVVATLMTPNDPIPQVGQLWGRTETITQESNIPLGPQAALLFATEAAKQLAWQHFRQLQQFLQNPINGDNQDEQALGKALENRLQAFYSAEVEISGLKPQVAHRTRLLASYSMCKARTTLLTDPGTLEAQPSISYRKRGLPGMQCLDMIGIGRPILLFSTRPAVLLQDGLPS